MVRRAENSIVNTYEFTLPQDCKVKRLDAYDKEWLDFIVDSRKGKQPWNGYDVIEGRIFASGSPTKSERISLNTPV